MGFAASEAEKTVNITIIDDAEVEMSVEQFTAVLMLPNGTTGVELGEPAEIQIHDNDGD